MAPLPARLASPRRMARRSPIRATAIEAELGTRYTVDTLKKLIRLHPNSRFIWIMGADNLVQLPQWRDWRETIGRESWRGRVWPMCDNSGVADTIKKQKN